MLRQTNFLLVTFLMAAIGTAAIASQTIAACSNSSSGNLRVVNSSAECHQDEAFLILVTGGASTSEATGPAKAQNTWLVAGEAGFNGFGFIAGSRFTATTNGGPLLISVDVTLLSNGLNPAVTCRPTIDGVWAGVYGGLPASSDFWTEGIQNINGLLYDRWSKTRLYPGVPAGTHTFAIECVSVNAPVSTCGQTIGCSMSVVEE